MPSVSPGSVSLQQGQTQQFTQSGITSPKWILEGGGTLDQSGLFTAGSVAGNSVIRAATSFWTSTPANTTILANDYLRIDLESGLDISQTAPRFNSHGDYVEVIYQPGVAGGQGLTFALEEISTGEWAWWRGNHGFYHGAYGNGGQESAGPAIVSGDVLRLEKVHNQIIAKLNGTTVYTFNYTFTSQLKLRIDTVALPVGFTFRPKVGGPGITGYSEAQATATTLAFLLTGYDGVELYCEANLMNQSDGSNVTSLTDQSGKGRHLTASTNYPTFETNEINSKPVIRFHGTSNPLKNTAQFTIRCGWILAKYSGGATFSDFKGLLSDLFHITILSSYNTGSSFSDQGIDMYEFRLNDRIYPAPNFPAPMLTFKLIFFRFWRNLTLYGVQLGQQTNFTSTKWHGDVPLLGLYSKDFCEADIREKSKAVADAYALTLADVYPYQADKGKAENSIQSVNFYDPPEGERISEVLDDAKRELDLKFSSRRQAEVKAMKAFHDSHYAAAVECIYRDYDVTPPEDISCYIDSPYQASGSVNDWSYAFKFKER